MKRNRRLDYELLDHFAMGGSTRSFKDSMRSKRLRFYGLLDWSISKGWMLTRLGVQELIDYEAGR